MRAWKSKGASGHGRSGLEDRLMGDLAARGVPYEYETVKVPWVEPEQHHKYTPDFILENGIIVETKGIWDSDDRKKMKYVKEQHPDLDIRMVFCPGKLNAPIRKNAKSTNKDWCIKIGLGYAEAVKQTKEMTKRGIQAPIVPEDWLNEPVCPKRLAVIEKLR